MSLNVRHQGGGALSINQSKIERYFSVNDVIASGGGRKCFRITKILDDRVRIQPTESKTASRLRYDKLSVIIENFENISPNRIEATVGEVLNANDLQDTQNESYLYGMAREYLSRQNLISVAFVQNELEKAVEKSEKSRPEDRSSRLKNAPKKPKQIYVTSTVYQRNPDVVVEVIKRANGVCEQCKSPAPFLRVKDGSPYLEVHHKHQLAHGGDDTVKNAVALCPNCHREAHFGINA